MFRSFHSLLDLLPFKDVNLPDGSEVTAGSPLFKQWALKNTGAAAWPEGTGLRYVNRKAAPVHSFTVPIAQPGEVVFF